MSSRNLSNPKMMSFQADREVLSAEKRASGEKAVGKNFSMNAPIS